MMATPPIAQEHATQSEIGCLPVMQTERFIVEVDFYEDEEQRWNEVWTSTTRTYATRAAAERAAIALEIKNAANGAGTRTRVTSYPVVK